MFYKQADMLSPEVKAAFKEAFDTFDADKNGVITAVELGTVLQGLSIKSTRAETEDLVAQIDSDSNGTIDFDEFLKIMAQKMADSDASEMVKEAFKAFDKDGDGGINPADLKAVYEGLGETVTQAEVDELVRIADKDGDGKLSEDEFTQWMNE